MLPSVVAIQVASVKPKAHLGMSQFGMRGHAGYLTGRYVCPSENGDMLPHSKKNIATRLVANEFENGRNFTIAAREPAALSSHQQHSATINQSILCISALIIILNNGSSRTRELPRTPKLNGK
jgi:hypothetical protein